MPDNEARQVGLMGPAGQVSLIGRVLSNTYRVEGLLGKGGMGAVYVAQHLRLPTKVAVKVLHAEAATSPEIFARFRREAEITSGLRHPNIVQVLDFNNLEDGTPYLVMEYLEGEDLHQRLQKRGRLSYDEVVGLLRAVGGGLMAAHKKQVVHRDLKPQNLFLARAEQGDEVVEIPKIVDFGISKIRHAGTDTQRTQDQQLLGTPNYMSPEQARGNNSEVDSRTDQWALAAIVYQCLCGRLAFAGDSLANIIYQVVLSEPPPARSLCPELPEHAELAIGRALSKNRENRFASVQDFVRAFAGQPTAALAHAGPDAMTRTGEHAGVQTPSPGQRQDSQSAGSLGGGLARSSQQGVPVSVGDPLAATASPTPAGSLSAAKGQVGGTGAHTLPPPGGAGRFWITTGIGALALIVIGVGAGAYHSRVRRELPPPAPPASIVQHQPVAVTLRVRPTPADATITVAGRPIESDGVLHLQRSSEPVEVVVSAPGHVEKRLSFRPQADQVLTVDLDPIAPPQQKVQEPDQTPVDQVAPKAGEDHHHRDKSKPHHQRQHDDAEDVDINLGPSK